ncbi:MAG: type I methionyl aminopeptidase [Patescibacteria group bacterium]|nr:type I methionyl aminopeptidase [Patescibacteria group bacterium]
MSIIIKTKEEIEILREGGKILASILKEVASKAKPGVTTKELDDYAYKLIKEKGDPAFLGYKSRPKDEPYPASLCTSINNGVVHCVPSNRTLKDGDIASLDLGLKYKDLYTDHAITVPVGNISKANQELLNVTREALMVGIQEARPGNTVGDIGYAIEKFVNKRYGIVRVLSGHGVGKKVHEDPFIPNFGKKGKGEKLVSGMVVAIEPMLNIGGDDVVFDNFDVRTKDGSLGAHFEHTILITENDPEILTMV